MSESSWSGAFRPVLVVLGAAFLAAYSVLALWYPRPASVTVVAVSVLAVAWLAFLLDYAVRLALTAGGERGHFVAHNIVALLSIALLFAGASATPLGLLQRDLRRYPTGPEEGYFIIMDCYRMAKIRFF